MIGGRCGRIGGCTITTVGVKKKGVKKVLKKKPEFQQAPGPSQKGCQAPKPKPPQGEKSL